MQIGGRWPVGGTPPRGLPESFVAAIAEAEAALPPADRDGSWTLTWLEGSPIAEHDAGARVTMGGPDAPGLARGHDGSGATGDDDALFPND